MNKHPKKVTILCDEEKYIKLRGQLLLQRKSFAQWVREKVEEELASSIMGEKE